ncbi:hypothetical protein POM88_017145 [Heracleum sosnowskyi]|uniref:Uncharacterized protein n=1 Tax=Heracleum sosnowskyi TaxID=360622 RepID=A0AAD8MY28_9APIA|nr:hypothetical protein POM88_017145 [Heracleum sosnowskyi]
MFTLHVISKLALQLNLDIGAPTLHVHNVPTSSYVLSWRSKLALQVGSTCWLKKETRPPPLHFTPLKTSTGELSDYEDELFEELHANPSVVEDLIDDFEKTESTNRGAPTAEDTKEDDEFTSPESSPEETLPFPLKPQDVDIDWTQHGPLSKREMDITRKEAGTFACVNMSSTIPERDIKKIMQFYSQDGSYAKPHPDMRPHRFDIDNIRVPRAVVTDRHIPLGVGAPLHPWLRQIVDWYQIAPIQLSPNSYRMALGLFIIYKELKYPDPSMLELSWFFSL